MPFGPFALQWRRPTPNPPLPPILPEDITYSLIHTASGPLELLAAVPVTSSDESKSPLFFAHGGFGCAEVWLLYMQYFSKRGYPCYAISYRGHGRSWYPWFWRMYSTTRHTMAEDLTAGIKYVQALETTRRGASEETQVVLVAHSAGGALAQYALSRKMFQVQGFCMLAAVPGFGSWSCYKFWALTAPIHFPYRAFHPRYVLATTSQVREAFFTAETPFSHVERFASLLSPFESMLWPMQSLFGFVTGPDVLSSIVGWVGRRNASSTSGAAWSLSQRLFVLAAEKDVLCTPSVLEDAAHRYQQSLADMLGKGKIIDSDQLDLSTSNRQGSSSSAPGVRFRVVKGLAHHLQNHELWEKGAEEIQGWIEQL